jgi:hypothetical protein
MGTVLIGDHCYKLPDERHEQQDRFVSSKCYQSALQDHRRGVAGANRTVSEAGCGGQEPCCV